MYSIPAELINDLDDNLKLVLDLFPPETTRQTFHHYCFCMAMAEIGNMVLCNKISRENDTLYTFQTVIGEPYFTADMTFDVLRPSEFNQEMEARNITAWLKSIRPEEYKSEGESNITKPTQRWMIMGFVLAFAGGTIGFVMGGLINGFPGALVGGIIGFVVFGGLPPILLGKVIRMHIYTALGIALSGATIGFILGLLFNGFKRGLIGAVIFSFAFLFMSPAIMMQDRIMEKRKLSK